MDIRPQDNVAQPDHPNMRLEMLGFKMDKSDGTRFGFSFNDPLVTKGDNSFISTKDCSLVFMDKFILMEFNLPSQRVFGFGERVSEFQLKEGVWNMWAKNSEFIYDDGTVGRLGGSGVHPFLLIQGRTKDDFIGMYFKNSNFMSPIVTFNADGTSKLTFITLGGVLDVLFFMHGSVSTIVKSYRSYVGGRPTLPPFWALGWQQGNDQWGKPEDVQASIDAYKAAGLPLEAVRLNQQFITNTQDQPYSFVTANPLHLVAEVAPGIPAMVGDNIFTLGMSLSILIKSAI